MAAAPLPTLEITGPTGARVIVAPRSPDDRIGELADALGVDPRDHVEVDGRRVARHETLGRAGIVRGSRLVAASAAVATSPAGGVVAVGEAGPGAGFTVALGPGRHIVGRSPHAAVHVDDPLVEAHHGVLAVAADGAVTFAQLTGRVPCRVGGEAVGGPQPVPAGEVVRLGASRIRIRDTARPTRARAALAMLPNDPWRRVLRRTPRVVPRWEPDPIIVPDVPTPPSRPGATGIIAALVAAAGAATVAVVLGSAMFVVFAAVGLVASGGMWVAAQLSVGHATRRHRAGWEGDVAAFAAAVVAQRAARERYHTATTPGLADAVVAATSGRDDLWCRRPGHPDVHRVSIGRGAVDWTVALDGGPHRPLPHDVAAVVTASGTFADAAVPVELRAGAAVAIAGPHAPAIARALVVQLVTWTGPADLQLVVLAAEPATWDWCRWLPHAAGIDGPRVVAADDGDRVSAVLGALHDGVGRHVVVVTDRPDTLSQRTGALRRFLGTAPSAAVVAVVGPDGSPPAMCRSVLEMGSVGVGRWWADASVDGHPVAVHAAGATTATATSVARALAGLHDPEDPGSSGAALVAAIGIGSLSARYGPAPIDDPIAIAAGWRAGRPDPAPIATLGATVDGVVEVDLARDGPHALIAGTTGSGKSELLRTVVVSLAARCSPDHLTFVLVDYKGGATFDACAELPHTVGIVTDLDDQLAARALASLDAEVRRREHVLRASGAVDLADHRARGGPPLPRLVVVIDEFATLAAELPAFLGALVGIAQRGRSLGVHLVLATQRPAGVVSDEIRANTNLRVALRLQDVADARDVVGADGPASFPRGVPGRAMLRLGADEHVLFQAARCTAPTEPVRDDRLHVVDGDTVDGAGESELAVLVRTIRNAAALSDVAPPHRPWLPPLPASVAAEALAELVDAHAAVGVVDDPAGQCRRALRWSPDDGNLALIGATGSGTTTALRSVLAALTATRSPAACHVYVIDARGDQRLDDLARGAHCGGVVRPHERERLSRLLRRLTAELDDRRAATERAGRPVVVLAVDGMTALRTALDDPLDHGDLDVLGRVVTEGPAAGVVTVLTAERPASLPAAILAACATRWIGPLDDPADATVCGLRAAEVPIGGPGRVVVATTRLQAQLAVLEPVVGAGRRDGPAPIEVLPAAVRVEPSGTVSGDGDAHLVVGVDFESLAAATLGVPDGEHVLVAGPARSGCSSALAMVVASWRTTHPGGQVHVVAPRRATCWPDTVDVATALAAIGQLESGATALLVVDDAERVDDARLAALAAERRPGLLIAAAGRPDALRAQYGHWTTVVRRSRVGILLAAGADIDGDLLGELLPRRPPIPPRPGLAWLVDASGRRLAQLSRTA